MNVPIILYDHLDPREFPGRTDLDVVPSWLPYALKNDETVKQYALNARNILRHVGYETRGSGSGVHGLLHQ